MSDQFRPLFAEFRGTAILVFVGGLAILSDGGHAVIAFGFGFALLIALYAVGEVSGGHFNPAVTLAAFLDGRISLTNGIYYWISQVAGGVLAALGLYWAFNKAAVGAVATNPGSTSPGGAVGDGSAFLLEVILTAVFVMVILKVTASADLKRGAFAAISLALVAIHMAAAPVSGASVNPARSIGPAILGDNAGNLWIYLVAPLVGAIVGWLIYQLATRESVELHIDTE